MVYPEDSEVDKDDVAHDSGPGQLLGGVVWSSELGSPSLLIALTSC